MVRPTLLMTQRPSLHIATRDSSRITLHWSGYIALTPGLAYVLQAHPGFYSWWPFKFLQNPQNRHELRQQTVAAIGALESGEKEPSIQLLRRMARQTDARTRAELADIENDIKARYAGKKGPRGSR